MISTTSVANAAAIIILALVSLQRLLELAYASFNERHLRGRGAVEFGSDHYPMIIGLHAAWLLGLWLLAWNRVPDLLWLAVFLLLQVMRGWVLRSLGDRWTTRILVLPDAPLIRTGPYRYCAHPNYAIVAAELLVLPLVFGLVWYAFFFSFLNALVLAIRIRAENHALRQVSLHAKTAG